MHTIRITLTPGYGWPHAEFTCQAAPGAACRLQCSGGCESWAVCDGDGGCESCRCTDENCDECKAEPGLHCTHCGQAIVDSACNALDWLDEDAWDTYAGPPDTPLRDGTIDVRWNGDSYEWRYPEAVA